MKLEELASIYGMNDYYDIHSGRTYMLSQAKAHPEKPGTLLVPVTDSYSENIIGNAIMDDPNWNKDK